MFQGSIYLTADSRIKQPFRPPSVNRHTVTLLGKNIGTDQQQSLSSRNSL